MLHDFLMGRCCHVQPVVSWNLVFADLLLRRMPSTFPFISRFSMLSFHMICPKNLIFVVNIKPDPIISNVCSFVFHNCNAYNKSNLLLYDDAGMEECPGCWTIMSRDQKSLALMADQDQLYLLDQTGQCDQVVMASICTCFSF